MCCVYSINMHIVAWVACIRSACVLVLNGLSVSCLPAWCPLQKSRCEILEYSFDVVDGYDGDVHADDEYDVDYSDVDGVVDDDTAYGKDDDLVI